MFQGNNDVFLSRHQEFSVKIEKLDNKKNKRLAAMKMGLRGVLTETKYIIEVESDT